MTFLRLVIETLNDVDPDRKCFRMIGGVLVERTVKEVTPALSNNRDKMTKLIEVGWLSALRFSHLAHLVHVV